jgi:hydroxymethylglutaryl-CoA lyase
MLKIVECPRDAMQGIHDFIDTDLKSEYINSLLQVGFDTIDFGSFVSPKAIPQMRDTAQLLGKLQLDNSRSKLLSIVANTRGAQDAVQFDEISYLGYPFSVSETFQIRNTNATIAESLIRVEEIQKLCLLHKKELVIYISMGFGNPYGDEWNVEVVQGWVNHLADMGVRILSLSDTIGVAQPDNISYLFGNLIPPYPDVEFGAHMHTQAHNWEEKVISAWENGCRRFDSALKGYGGCPMAKDELTGNMPTEKLVEFFQAKNIETGLNMDAFQASMQLTTKVFH